jgi:hypothetical protein
MAYIGYEPAAKPLTSADIADSIITTAKIADGAVVNADIANSTINLTTKVTGTLPVANGGTGLTALGSANQVLAVNSGGTALAYTAVSSDYVLLATSTITSNVSSVSIDGYFSSTYTTYKVIFYGVFGSSVTDLRLRFNRSGSAITTANYNFSGFGATVTTSSSALDPQCAVNQSVISLGNYYTAVDRSLSGFTEINNPLSTTAYKMTLSSASSYYFGANQDTLTMITGSVLKDSTSALSGFTFLAASGTLNGGTFKIYGIK